MQYATQEKTTRLNLLTPKDAAKQLGTTAGTMNIWRSTGRWNLPYVKIGRLVRYKQEDIDAFIARRRMGAV